MLNPPKDVTYAGVASLRSIRLVTFLAELNELKLVGLDVGNAYLLSPVREACYIVGTDIFKHASVNLDGCIIRVDRALYGLRSSGAAWHSTFSDTLRDLGFFPSKADPDVWMRDAGDCYEYIAVYTDHLLVAMKDPATFVDILESDPYNYTLKGDRNDIPKTHLGGSFSRDEDGTLCWNASKYTQRLRETYRSVFYEEPKKAKEPMRAKTFPELDESKLCGDDDQRRFQQILGALQWTITLCRFDICNAVLCLNAYQCNPRQNHLKLIRHVADYILSTPDHGIRFRTQIPDYSHLYDSITTYDWADTVYDNASEVIPTDAPTPKGRYVRTTTYKDANLMHNLVNGRSCSGVLHFINQTPLDWFCKRQAQVETATYGSEFVAARCAVEQIMDLRYTLRMLGVPILGQAWLFGDNKGVIQSSTIPHSKLAKRWNALSYHRVREAVASKYVTFLHIDGKKNPSDLLTKNLTNLSMKDFVNPLLAFKGDTLSYLPISQEDDSESMGRINTAEYSAC